MKYATHSDVEDRMGRELSEGEINVCNALLEDAAIIIDSYNSDASEDNKKVVSCRMVIRAIGNNDADVPVGATQGSMSALGYSQSWTMTNGATGELYLGKLEKKLLGYGNKIGSYSQLEDM